MKVKRQKYQTQLKLQVSRRCTKQKDLKSDIKNKVKK